MRQNRFFAPVIIGIAIVLLLAASGAYYYLHTIIHDGKPVENIRYTDWEYQIDSAEVVDGELQIKGWCFKQTQDTKEGMSGLRIILQDIHDPSRKWYLRANYGLPRPEVEEFFSNWGDAADASSTAPDGEVDGNASADQSSSTQNIQDMEGRETIDRDYTYCGFEVSADLEKTGIKDTDCEIIIQQNEYSSDIVPTGEYIVDGELSFKNPDTFIEPDVAGTDLEEIVRDGVLRAHVPDCGFYVYQKDWKLYWLIDENNAQGMEAVNFDYYDYMALSLRDSMEEYDYHTEFMQGHYSQDKSAEGMNTGHYKVIIRDIPVSFPVAWIEIGVYNADGTLHSYPRFFPRYDFQVS